MEFALEGILQTLLVGAVTSLCIASLVFVFFEHRLRIRAIERLFKFVLYESQPYSDQKIEGDADQPEQVFITLLLIAALFGLGIVAESASDFATDHLESPRLLGVSADVFSDPGIRAEAFEVVARSELSSGRAGPNLARLLTDHMACQALDEAKSVATSPCESLRRRVNDLYYYAKNWDFHDSNYFEELSGIQARIDFIRTLSHAFFLLFLQLAITFLISIAVEAVDTAAMRFYRVDAHFVVWWSGLVGTRGTLLHHLKNLAAWRILTLSAISFGIALAGLSTWRDVEGRYDKRVLGYFLCCVAPGQASATEIGPEKVFERARQGLGALPIPDSPFQVFEGNDSQFEPSSIEAMGMLGRRRLYLVANDKNRTSPLMIFAAGESGKLDFVLTPRLIWPGAGTGTAGMKVEALDLRRETDGVLNRWTGLMAGTVDFAGGPQPSILRISSNWTGDLMEDSYQIASQTERQLTFKVESIELTRNLCDVFRSGNAGADSCVIEGLAQPAQNAGGLAGTLLGVRYMIKGGRAVPTLALIQIEVGSDGRLTPVLVTISERQARPAEPTCQIQGNGISGFGISGLELDIHGNLLVLASYEADDDLCAPQSATSGAPASSLDEVQGALWRVPADVLAQPSRLREMLADSPPLMRFTHKPEGITFRDEGRRSFIAVFDDDASRKSPTDAPAKFPELEYQAVFFSGLLP